jgi:hypothetical protein
LFVYILKNCIRGEFLGTNRGYLNYPGGQFQQEEVVMGLGRGALLWLIGVPLPVIILIAVFWHH